MSGLESERSDIEQTWDVGCSALLPKKSKDRNENTYEIFKRWSEEKN